MAVQKPSRGVRNNNPGNIEKSRDRWKGLATDQPDARFFTFSEPEWGIRAMSRILINYQKKYDRNTIREVIERWAPDVENNTEAYINAVSRETGFTPDQELDLRRFDHLFPVVKAIIRHENGYAPYTDAQIREGLLRAGIAPPAPPKAAPDSLRQKFSAVKKPANENTKKSPPAKKQAPRKGFGL